MPDRAADQWYRSPEWNPDEFAAKLGRARSHNRPQYRRVKAVSILEAGDRKWTDAGFSLLQENVDDGDVAPFERVWAHSLLGRYEQQRGHLDSAERHLRAALRLVEEAGNPSGTSGEEEIALAEILLDMGGWQRAEEAKGLLQAKKDDPPLFVTSRFRASVAHVRVALIQGDRDAAVQWSRSALELAGATHSGLQYHPQLGLVKTDQATITWLRQVATDQGSTG